MKRDLVVLVPDVDIEVGLRALLARPEALSIRPIRDVQFFREPHRDPGVYKRSHLALALVREEFERALVVLDEAWAGTPGSVSIERDVEARCRPHWHENVRCVCIVPEVEAWVWSDSPHVAGALGWSDFATLRGWLDERGHWARGDAKPADPKRAVRAALRARRLPASPALFGHVGSKVSVQRCQDPALTRLVTILRERFPLGHATNPS